MRRRIPESLTCCLNCVGRGGDEGKEVRGRSDVYSTMESLTASRTYGKMDEELLVSIAFEPLAATGSAQNIVKASIRLLVQRTGAFGLDELKEGGLWMIVSERRASRSQWQKKWTNAGV